MLTQVLMTVLVCAVGCYLANTFIPDARAKQCLQIAIVLFSAFHLIHSAGWASSGIQNHKARRAISYDTLRAGKLAVHPTASDK